MKTANKYINIVTLDYIEGRTHQLLFVPITDIANIEVHHQRDDFYQVTITWITPYSPAWQTYITAASLQMWQKYIQKK